MIRPCEAVTVSALHGGPLQQIFAQLDVQSLCSVAQVSRDWRTAGDSNDLWYRLAASKWPRHTLRLKPWYSNYKELLKGDNRLSACPTIDLAKLGKCSSYKYNRPAYFFQCNLYSLQWDRAAKLIRLCFEARGDIDSRHPDTSYAAVVMTRPEHNYLTTGMVQPCSFDLVQTARAEACELWICSERHIKGCLVWTEELFQSPLTDAQSRQQGYWRTDSSLVFCYANAVVSGPYYLDADCRSVELLKISAYEHFGDAFLAQSTSFELPCEPGESLKLETEAESRLRWTSLPDAVQQNPRWWGHNQ